MTARLALLVGVLAGILGCTGGGEGGERGHGGASATLVEGTVLEAATGEPLAGVLITGPGEVRASSDAQGRFSMTLEAPGELVAEGPDGLRAQNPVRSLDGERLEVVLHLR